jgi:hypothetical protein
MKLLKSFKLTAIILAALTTLPLVQGCALLVAGGVAAGAVYGTVKYAKNTLQATEEVSLDRAWSAANGTLKELQMPISTSNKDGASGKLKAQNAKDQPVLIELVRKSDHLTEIEITVGTFDSAENRTASQQIYDQMKSRF